MQSSKLGMWMGYQLSIEGLRKGYTCYVKNGMQKDKGQTQGEFLRTKPPGSTSLPAPIKTASHAEGTEENSPIHFAV